MIRSAPGTVTSPPAIAEDARQTLARLEHVIRIGAVTDPAQAYRLMGVTGQMARSLQHSLGHLSQWWRTQERDHGLDVTEGPFADDPSAAVATTVQSLTAAAAACADLASALERAQMCSCDLAPLRPDQSARGGKPLRRWNRR